MNYLAHTLLSTNHIDYQLGNLLADPLKGRAWKGCSQQHLDGLKMHKAIDRFTDNSPYVKTAKAYLGNGYLKGVVLDIVFDHYLSKHWKQFVRIDFEDFIQSFYRRAEQQSQHQSQLPHSGQVFIKRLIRYDFFHLYRDFSTLQHVFKKFDQRLSAKILAKESASDYLPLIKQYNRTIESVFLSFFPELIQLFLQHSGADSSRHYFKLPIQ